ncbi:MAG: MFS transporter [Rhizobiales bacterium]|nr:MFS transporter [Hyphomicrobiales bacterium]
MLLAAAMQLAHQTWFTLLNNFAIGEIDFSGREIGILQSLREIPGFLSFGVVFILLVMREQPLALISLVALGLGTALAGYFPSEYGFYATTMLMSLGFHYYETVAQSLALQWLPKHRAAQDLGRIAAAGSLAALGSYGLVYLTFELLGLGFANVYLIAGAATLAITLMAWLAFPMFRQEVVQRRELIVRKRYGLYYALVFMSGARRQIFIVFAGFMMVEKFGYSVTAITTLFLVNHVMNMFLAPRIGRLIAYIGERRALIIEYIGLVGVFTAYAFVDDPMVAAGLYIVDHAFFALAIAIKTYFQKIADPADIAPSTGVAFTINHIAAVFLPVALGYVWLRDPSAVFLLGAGMAFVSLMLAHLVPRAPAPGSEVVWPGAPAPVRPAD